MHERKHPYSTPHRPSAQKDEIAPLSPLHRLCKIPAREAKRASAATVLPRVAFAACPVRGCVCREEGEGNGEAEGGGGARV